MKDITKVIIAAIIATTIMFVSAVWSARAETYPAVFVVHEIDYATDTMTLIDFNGWMWDVVGVIMNDVGTEIIYDDEVQSIRYCGRIEQGWR